LIRKSNVISTSHTVELLRHCRMWVTC